MEKVRLPSDTLTPGQIKQLHGEMVNYNLGGPLRWQQLLALPADLRRKYLEKLRDEYQASQVMIADMLGISVHTFRRKCKDWGVRFQPNGGQLSDGTLDRWAEFTGKRYNPAAKKETQTPEPPEEPAAPAAPAPLVPHSGTMVFHGPACEALRTMETALRDKPCTLTITWETEE